MIIVKKHSSPQQGDVSQSSSGISAAPVIVVCIVIAICAITVVGILLHRFTKKTEEESTAFLPEYVYINYVTATVLNIHY